VAGPFASLALFGVERFTECTDIDVLLFHAGTRRDEAGQLVTAGGRVVAVTSVAPTLDEAQQLSIRYADGVELTDKHYRSDIGWRELSRRAGAA
jgi:phosphoribosylamine---glycine ligase